MSDEIIIHTAYTKNTEIPPTDLRLECLYVIFVSEGGNIHLMRGNRRNKIYNEKREVVGEEVRPGELYLPTEVFCSRRGQDKVYVPYNHQAPIEEQDDAPNRTTETVIEAYARMTKKKFGNEPMVRALYDRASFHVVTKTKTVRTGVFVKSNFVFLIILLNEDELEKLSGKLAVLAADGKTEAFTTIPLRKATGYAIIDEAIMDLVMFTLSKHKRRKLEEDAAIAAAAGGQ